jgi:hypothetical protein
MYIYTHTHMFIRTMSVAVQHCLIKKSNEIVKLKVYSFISNLSYDRSTASSKTIPPLNAI